MSAPAPAEETGMIAAAIEEERGIEKVPEVNANADANAFDDNVQYFREKNDNEIIEGNNEVHAHNENDQINADESIIVDSVENEVPDVEFKSSKIYLHSACGIVHLII